MSSLNTGALAWGTFWTPGGANTELGWGSVPLAAEWSVLATSPTEGGFWLQQDCTGASQRTQPGVLSLNSSGSQSIGSASPSHRYGAHLWLTYKVTALPSGDLTVAWPGNSMAIKLRSTGVFALYAGNNFATLYEQGTVAISDFTKEYALDYWTLLYDASGNPLHPAHCVLRIWEDPFGTPTLVDTLHTYSDDLRILNRSLFAGDKGSTNLGVKQSFGTVVLCMEDADSPFGKYRTEWYKANAAGTYQQWNLGGTGGGTKITAINPAPPVADANVPAANYLQNSSGTSIETYKYAAQTVGGSATPGVNDTPVFVEFLWRESYNIIKGSTCKLGEPTIYDGTNTVTYTGMGSAVGGGAPAGPYNDYETTFDTNAAGTAWTTANLGGGASENQFGITENDTGGNHYLDDMQYVVAWVKSGETLAAVPGPDTTATSLILPSQRGWVD